MQDIPAALQGVTGTLCLQGDHVIRIYCHVIRIDCHVTLESNSPQGDIDSQNLKKL